MTGGNKSTFPAMSGMRALPCLFNSLATERAMPRPPSFGVQIAASHLAYWYSRGLSFDDARARMEASGHSFRTNTLRAADRYATAANTAREASEILPSTSTVADLYGDPSLLPFDTVGMRVLATYTDADGNIITTKSIVVDASTDDSLQDIYDQAESELESEYGSQGLGVPSMSLIASVPFPPQSAQ